MRFNFIFLLPIIFSLASCGGGQENIGPAGEFLANSPASSIDGDSRVSEFIVKFSPTDPRSALTELNQETVGLLSSRAGLALRHVRTGALGAHVLESSAALSKDEAKKVLASLSATEGIAYAEPNLRMKASTIPNDPSFSDQWYLVEPEKTLQNRHIAGAVNAVTAWDITQGATAVVVAVVDTGVLSHADLAGRLLPGYDFVSDPRAANDGNGRDNDATDPGDWIANSELAYFDEAVARVSTFHGTHVAGIVAAAGNNGYGVTGISWNARLLPVRVLGKGGGTTSDISDGIIWAAGGTVPGAPINPNPAKVINLSLGGNGPCLSTTQNAINFARSRGATVVVAAGNENEPTTNKQPANCQGVITVAAVGWTGAKASYSNHGAQVTVAAPGGDDDGAILSLGDKGQQSPNRDNALTYKQGTSMAAPVVSGVAALMLAVNPNLTPDDVKSILQYTANSFPSATGKVTCTAQLCGTGIVSALAAVRAAATGGSGTASQVPQSGWWYQGEAEGGRGYAIEIHNNSLFMAGFTYEAAGRATWFVSTGSMTDTQHYSGSMLTYSGGQTLSGPFKAGAQSGTLGAIDISFSTPTTGRITWPNGSKTDIVRYNIPGASAGAATRQNGFNPEAGWWWNQSEGGRGFAIEVQGDRLFIAGFMYDANGLPTWYVSWGQMSDPYTYNGKWWAYTNGQPTGGAYRSPQLANANVADMRLVFSDGRNAVLTLPNGRSTSLGRYLDYGVQTPVNSTPESLLRANKLLGQWRFSYTIMSTWVDRFLFDTIYASEVTKGRYVAVGYNQYDQDTIAFFYEPTGQYAMLTSNPAEQGYSYDDFYLFDLSSDAASATGCYYLAYHDGRISKCYMLVGTRTSYAYESPPDSKTAVTADSQRRAKDLIAKEASEGQIDAIALKQQSYAGVPRTPSTELVKYLRSVVRR